MLCRMSEAPEDFAARMIAMEKAVDWLQRDLAQLRQGPARAAPPPPEPVLRASPAPPVIEALRVPLPIPRSPPARLDLETLIGRYGMLAPATLLARAPVGTFGGWAVNPGRLCAGRRLVCGLRAAAP